MAALGGSADGPVENTDMPVGKRCIIVTGESLKTQQRIAVHLTGRNLRPSLQVDTPGELFEMNVDPTAIVVLACDVDLPREIATLRRVRRELREPAIVAVSPPATGTGVRRALDAGADALVFEPELESTLAVAVSAVASGQSVVPRKVRASVERPSLSHRERQVLVYVSRGFTNAQIAKQLFLSESTIKSHLSSVFAKFGVRSRREAAALFLDLEQATPWTLAAPERTIVEATSRATA
jgi:DNA-binding NarL/FixJ family response regulator